MPDHSTNSALVRFLVEAGPRAGEEFSFDTYEVFVVGRAADNQLCLPDNSKVSRYHCRFEIQPPECRVVDLASTNGTFRNDQRIREAMLEDGDVVRIADTVIRLEIVATGNHQPSSKPTIAWKASEIDGEGSANTRDELVAGYRLEEPIGQGAMGRVYRAVHAKTGETAAIKIILPEDVPDSSALEKFLREVSILSSLRHNRIVELLEFGLRDKRPYLVMEHIPTIGFNELLESQPPSHRIRIASGIACQILEGLQFAHENNVVHRDVKPGNVLVYRKGRKLKAKLADFGMAKNYLLAGMSSLSCDEDKKGTLAFMATEQFLDCRYTKPASDIYSAGACLYYYLTDNFVFDFQDTAEAVAAILNGTPVPVIERDSTIPPELAAIVDRAVAREAADRFSTADEFQKALLPFTKRK